MTTNWLNKVLDHKDDLGGGTVEAAYQSRLHTILSAQADLAAFGLSSGYSQNQIRGAFEALFTAFLSEWMLYLLTGSSALATAITNDTTLSWLDLDASGQTIRARLINRLS